MKRLNLKKYFVGNASVIALLFSGRAYADTPEEVNQLINLLTDILNWILLIVPIAAGLMIGYQSLMKIMADNDGAEIADRNKRIKTILVSAVVAFIGVGIVRVVVGYFN